MIQVSPIYMPVTLTLRQRLMSLIAVIDDLTAFSSDSSFPDTYSICLRRATGSFKGAIVFLAILHHSSKFLHHLKFGKEESRFIFWTWKVTGSKENTGFEIDWLYKANPSIFIYKTFMIGQFQVSKWLRKSQNFTKLTWSL